MRGEYSWTFSSRKVYPELPPRARRIPRRIFLWRSETGTTSACAENTRLDRGSGPDQWNYLRVRGEYSPTSGQVAPPKELPPRARRIQHIRQENRVTVGTTSACAENTGAGCSSPGNHRNYLRVRGEYHTAMMQAKDAAELPPRARRIPFRWAPCSASLGTTSACAENT